MFAKKLWDFVDVQNIDESAWLFWQLKGRLFFLVFLVADRRVGVK